MGAKLWPVAADLCTLKPRSHALDAATCRTRQLLTGCSWLFGDSASLHTQSCPGHQARPMISKSQQGCQSCKLQLVKAGAHWHQQQASDSAVSAALTASCFCCRCCSCRCAATCPYSCDSARDSSASSWNDIESASAMTGMQRLQLHWWCHSVRHQLGMPSPQEAPQNEHFLGCTGFKPPESRSLPCSSCMTH